MRTTVDFPDELLEQLRAISRDTGKTLSTVVVDTMNRSIRPPARATIVRGRSGFPAFADALALLALVTADARHEFWPDDIAFDAVPVPGLIGHRQVTDAYLAQLARHRGGRVATLDRAMAATHADVVELVPVS